MIHLEGIRKTYRLGDTEVHALRGVSLRIEPGEFTAIMGPSGSGKSTLLHLLGLLDAPDAGSYRLLGSEVAGLGEDALAALRSRTFGFVFQQFHLLARTSALENVILPRVYAGRAAGDTAKAAALLGDVGLGDRAEHRPNELSGGQQQRVAIARALVNSPRVLFADEPTGNLDTKSGDEIMEVFERLNRSGVTVILVTHEPEIAARCRRVIHMRDGVVERDERRGPPVAAPIPVDRAAPPSPRRGLLGLLPELSLYFSQALRALLANKLRSALSMLGILIGVASVIAMLAVGAGARRSIEERLSSLGSNLLMLSSGARRVGGVSMERGAAARLTLADARDLAASLTAVKRTCPLVQGRVQVNVGGSNQSTRVLGGGANYGEMHASSPVHGRFFTEDEVSERARVAVMGLTPLRALFGDRDPVGETVKINRINFTVIGVLPEKGSGMGGDQDDRVIVPVTTAMYRLLGRQYVDSIDIEAVGAEKMAEASNGVIALMLKNHRVPPSQQGTAFDLRNMAEVQAMLTQTSQTLSLLLASIAAVSLLVGGIGIMNIMLVSVAERTREIGLRKALGAKRRDLLAQFLVEALVLSLLGGAIGVVLGIGCSLLVSLLAGWATVITPLSVILGFLFSALIGILFGILPARRAAAMNPIEALRSE
ncbi:MAG: ABC transporter permease [Spirochaetes bacterium]|nr:ABC transporter permease [Spirochaetota bacterium]